MRFSDHVEPYLGTYTGPNIIHGQVIVRTSATGITEMLYQALTSDGNLVAGRAEVTLLKKNGQTIMQLDWQWLTEPTKSGVSIWHEIPAQDKSPGL